MTVEVTVQVYALRSASKHVVDNIPAIVSDV